MHLQLDVLLCDRRPQTHPKVTLGNLLAWFITAKLPFISSLPSQSEGLPKIFVPRSWERLESGLHLTWQVSRGGK